MHADLSHGEAWIEGAAMEFLQRVSGGIERGVRTVLENPLLLIGLMVLSLLLKRFAAPNREGSGREPAI